MPRKLILALCCIFLFSSCGYMPYGGTDDLLVAPILNERQASLQAALSATLNLGDVQYKYPQTGEYRSPFVFHDLDGDGLDEAIVFYSLSFDPTSVRVKVLKEGGAGDWESFYDISGPGDEIDFIEFAPLLERDAVCMVIGWKSTRRSSTMGVYSFDGGTLREEIVEPYEQFLMGDYDVDGLIEILLVTQEDEAFYLNLFGKGIAGRLMELDRFVLAPETSGVLQLLQGNLWVPGNAIYVDEEQWDGVIATEIVRVSASAIEPLAAWSGGDDYTTTFRARGAGTGTYRDNIGVLSSDPGGDGDVWIPVNIPLPGQEENDEAGSLMITQYLRLAQGGFEVFANAVINADDGYQIFLPDKWLDTVTVVQAFESREWMFYKLDTETQEAGSELLLRIRTHTVGDYIDKFVQSSYLRIAESGALEYYAEIPSASDEPLAITEQELQMMFRLL